MSSGPDGNHPEERSPTRRSATAAATAPAAGRPSLEAGQIVTVFRSRRRAGSEQEYERVAAEMDEHARRAPGFVDIKTFAAEDGEQVSVVTFASAEEQAAWRADARHRAAQDRGRSMFYDEYTIQTGPSTRVRQWRRPED